MSFKNENEFEIFMSQLLKTNATLDFFTDFQKCRSNLKKIEMKLTAMNYLLGKENLREAIHDLWEENPSVFSVLEILIAVRKSDRKQVLDSAGTLKMLEKFFDSESGVIEYIAGTGLWEIFQNRQITNLVDYVFGVEVGLDTNARKNRGGKLMENSIARIFENAKIPFAREIYSREFPEISNVLGTDEKRFDFVVKTSQKTYLIEVNFYSSGGSKLNEVARAYSELAPKINQLKKFEFVWITDGQGWLSARNKLQEAFSIIPSVYNLTNFGKFIEKVKSEI